MSVLLTIFTSMHDEAIPTGDRYELFNPDSLLTRIETSRVPHFPPQQINFLND